MQLGKLVMLSVLLWPVLLNHVKLNLATRLIMRCSEYNWRRLIGIVHVVDELCLGCNTVQMEPVFFYSGRPMDFLMVHNNILYF